MTEEEQKNLREHFLEPETRCGTYISSEMKAVWKAQMDILEVVIGICKKHNIKYFLTDGSLLGAIRHGGYIPWDDDIDISMLRPDYDRFCQVAPIDLPAHLFMQTGATDPEYCDHYIKIRDGRMTAVTEFARKVQYRCNQGMFIDIMPLDAIPVGRELARQLRIQKIIHFLRAKGVAHGKTSMKGYALRVFCWALYKFFGYKRLHERYENLLRKTKENGIVGHRFFPVVLPKEHWNVTWFDEVKTVPYEYLMVDVPAKYEEILSFTYGDWHKFVKGASFHTDLYFNTKESYKTVIPRKFGYYV